MRRVLLSFLAVLLFVPAVFAQVDKATFEAVALDQSGTPLPGVSVTLTRPETGYSSMLITDSSGAARFVSLTPGTYDVSLGLEGFAPINQNGIALRVGENAKVNVTLRAAASEAITVTADSPIVDVHKTDSSTNIVPEQIESLPVADRDFQRLAFITPGVQRERGGFRFIGGGPVVGAGGNASQTSILVNGVDLTDPSLGLARTRFSQDAIREFRVIANRFDTEIGGSSGGALSVITKSGTNSITGNVFGFYRDDSLRAKGALDQKKFDYGRRQLGATIGGPIIRDRLFYFGSVEQINEDNVTLFRPAGAFASQAADIDHPFDQTLLFGSADVQLSAQHTGGIRGVYEKYDEDNFRVGGVVSESAGQTLERKNWNVTFEDNWAISNTAVNEARLQFGGRRFFEPTNSNDVSEWFSSGNTIQIGSNILGDLLGSGRTWEVRDTVRYHLTAGRSSHDLKGGVSVQRVKDRSRIDTFQEGLLIYVTDTRALPLAYSFGVGSSDVSMDTTIYGVFLEDSWRPTVNLLVNLGLRYDLDTNGNNPDFTYALLPNGRDRDTNNYQPRFSFTYDLRGDGTNVLRGGAGRFTGRFLLVPALVERAQNGTSGRIAFTRINGALLGVPALTLDPAHPTTTGIPLKPAAGVLAPDLVAPEATQASVGYTMKLGSSRLYLDTEAIYVEGDDEIIIRDVNWSGNATRTRPNTTYDQINTYTNDGHSKYKALVLSLNGNIRQSDLITASITYADKQNINDDFSPEFPFGYPNDPANIEAEYGRSRSDERMRFVLSGIFNAGWGVKVAPILEYGSGQPWTHRLGYDFNGDGKNSDRPAGVERFSENGPVYRSVSLRVSKGFTFFGGTLEAIAEAFNLANTENFDVSSVDQAEFLSGPTAANPALAAVRNPNFGKYRATLPPREIQLGLRWLF